VFAGSSSTVQNISKHDEALKVLSSSLLQGIVISENSELADQWHLYLGENAYRLRLRDNSFQTNDSLQYLISTLGSPSSVNYKENGDYFYNYYWMGVDFLIDGIRHVIVKIVIHSNFPGHYNFSKYHFQLLLI
jgi:hypothetical protein